jgi:hypothetical protein
VEVSLATALQSWIAGEPLSVLAEHLLGEVPDPEWRLEQIVDRVSRGFGHAISWMIAAVLERANTLLLASDLPPICPALPLYVRYGVDSVVALRLITGTVRSRDLAVRVARAALRAHVGEEMFQEWLASVPVEDWPELFDASPNDVLDLLEAIRDPQGDLLRRLLEDEEVEVGLVSSLPDGPVRLALSPRAADDPGLVEAESLSAGVRAALPGALQADLRTVLATGVAIEATLHEGRMLALRVERPR